MEPKFDHQEGARETFARAGRGEAPHDDELLVHRSRVIILGLRLNLQVLETKDFPY